MLCPAIVDRPLGQSLEHRDAILGRPYPTGRLVQFCAVSEVKSVDTVKLIIDETPSMRLLEAHWRRRRLRRGTGHITHG
jgi:hypothetical protein